MAGRSRGGRSASPFLAAVAFLAVALLPAASRGAPVKLPPPVLKGNLSLEQAIAGRRTGRTYADKPLGLAEVSQLCWASQGVTEPRDRRRAAPSAGALYPLELYLALGRSDDPGLRPGIYRYLPLDHALEMVAAGDRRGDAARAALRQEWMARAGGIFLVAAAFERTTRKYGDRGYQYTHQEAGAAAENLLLQAAALGLEAGIVGAFHEEDTAGVFSLPRNLRPLLLLPVGR